MSLPYDFLPSAREDVSDAYFWYESYAAGRGDQFLRELHAHATDVCSMPELYGRAHSGLRAAPLPVSKYILYYRIDPAQVTVVAVLHERADPRKLRGRR
jgi:plasmid stabilization system protein ParE